MSSFSDIADNGLMPATLDTFGDQVVYQPRAGTSYEVTVALDNGESLQSASRVYATAWAPLSSFTGGEPVKGDSVLIGSITYRVAEIERDYLDGRTLKLVVTNAQ